MKQEVGATGEELSPNMVMMPAKTMPGNTSSGEGYGKVDNVNYISYSKLYKILQNTSSSALDVIGKEASPRPPRDPFFLILPLTVEYGSSILVWSWNEKWTLVQPVAAALVTNSRKLSFNLVSNV